MKRFTWTPGLITIVALPILFLILPNGIPFLHAVSCSAVNGAPSSVETLTANCTSGGSTIIGVGAVTVNVSSTKCEVTVSAPISIFVKDDCCLNWWGYCCNNDLSTCDLCDGYPVAAGCSSGTFIKTHGCTGKKIVLELIRANNNCQGCSPTKVVLVRTKLDVGPCNN
jgi:hypothetical protein